MLNTYSGTMGARHSKGGFGTGGIVFKLLEIDYLNYKKTKGQQSNNNIAPDYTVNSHRDNFSFFGDRNWNDVRVGVSPRTDTCGYHRERDFIGVRLETLVVLHYYGSQSYPNYFIWDFPPG